MRKGVRAPSRGRLYVRTLRVPPDPLHLLLQFPDLLTEFPVDSLSSCSVDDTLVFIHQLPLDPQHNRLVPHDHPNDIVSGLVSVMMANHLCTLVDGLFEKATGELVLASFTNVTRDLAPRVGHEYDVLQRCVTTNFAEHLEIPSAGSGKPCVGDAVKVDDPGKLGPLPISVKKFIRNIEKQQTPMRTYAVAKGAAIISKTSISLFEVSSNPGISMRTTLLPSRVNSSARWTSVALEPKRVLTGSFEPLARLTNWGQLGWFLVIVTERCTAHRCFPASSRPHDSVTTIRITFQRGNELSGTHAIMMGGSRGGVDRRLLVLASHRGGGL